MKRIWLLLAIMFLTTGCTQDSVVKNENTSESSNTQTATTSDENTSDETTDDKDTGDGKATDEAPDAREEDKGVDSSISDPESELDELRANGAAPKKFLAFAKQHARTDLGFQALTILAQRLELDEESKGKMLEMMKSDYLMHEDASDSQAMTAVGMLLSVGGPEHRNDVSKAAAERFVMGKDELDSSANRVIQLIMQQGSETAKQKIVDQIAGKFADDKAMLGMLTRLSRGIPSQATISFLKKLISESTSDDIKGNATLTLAMMYNSIPDMKGFLKDKRFKSAVSEETFKFIDGFDSADYSDEIELLLTQAKDVYGDVESSRGTVGEAAAAELFVIQNLAVGKTAPDIVGEDLDGEEFKLSDYRGKVVMLDFWGDW